MNRRRAWRAALILGISVASIARPVTDAGDDLPGDGEIIELRVAELRQLFDAIDPSPFRDKRLDPDAAEFIVDRSKDVPRDAPLALLVHVDRPMGLAHEGDVVRDAIHQYFQLRAERCRRDLRQLFRRGRISLGIGLGFLVMVVGLGDLVARSMRREHLAEVLREGLSIGGWVAMWRPLEVFLYDWWPIRADVRLFDRLAMMPVHVRCGSEPADAWRERPLAPQAAPAEPPPPDPRDFPGHGSRRRARGNVSCERPHFEPGANGRTLARSRDTART